MLHFKILKILGARWVTRKKVRTEDQQMADATAQRELSVKAPAICSLLGYIFYLS